MNVLVTGATGFVGRVVVQRLLADGRRVRAAVRTSAASLPAGVEPIVVGDIDGGTRWADALAGIDAVVHLAARVHVPDASLADARRVNRDGTARLARSCSSAIRFVHVSSIRAVVDESHPEPVDEHTAPRPSSAYGISKLEGERELERASWARRFSFLVLRPPLVIGPGVGGNLRRLVQSIRRGVPLPIGAVDNRRSTIAVDNLADAIVHALAPGAPEGIALALTDGPPHSTAALVREIAAALRVTPRLVPVPPRWLELVARTTGCAGLWSRLCGDLEIAPGAAELLGWTPRVPFSTAVHRCVHDEIASE
jgi:nucleoside-diphosphate-sugar epimerase